MKTNPSARRIRRLQNTILCLAVVALAGVAFTMGDSLAARFGQITVCQTAGGQAPNVDLGAVMGAMR
jgi:hypothetical protein